jgi:hypothetical protein
MALTLTPNLGLPFYTGSDPPAGMDQQKALALKLDGISSLQPPLIASLPGSPVDGQEVYYLADATNGVIWHLRYRAAAPGTYKWETVGGGLLYAEITAVESCTSTAYTALTTAGPIVTLPLAGDYIVDHGWHLNNSNAGIAALMSYDIGAIAASDNDAARGVMAAAAGIEVPIIRRRRKTVTAAGALTAKYKVSAGQTYFQNRWLSATPIRVG